MEKLYLKEDEFGYFEFINKFNKYTHYELNEELSSHEFNSYKEKFEFLRKLVFTDYKRQINMFYILLDAYGYNFNYDIIDAVSSLNEVHDVSDIKDLIEFYENSLYIDKITYEDGLFTIYSNGKEYNFIPCNKFSHTNSNLINTSVFTPFYAVMKNQIYMNDDLVYDTRENICMSEDTYNELYFPTYQKSRRRIAC